MTVYTKSTCAPCRTLKTWLDSKGVTYEEKNVEDPVNMQEMIDKTGMWSVPQTIVGDRVISGPHFSLLSELLQA